MLVISTREFREKQGMYLQKAKNGEDIILKSRENGSFKLVPMTEDNIVIDRTYILIPDANLARAITADQLLVGVKEDLKKMFEKSKK